MHTSHHFVFTAHPATAVASAWPELQDRTLQELLRKWGLQEQEHLSQQRAGGDARNSTSHTCGWLLRRFDYCAVSPSTGRMSDNDAATSAAVTEGSAVELVGQANNNIHHVKDDMHGGFVSKPLPYHDGLAQDFLRAFFASDAVQAALETRRSHSTQSTSSLTGVTRADMAGKGRTVATDGATLAEADTRRHLQQQQQQQQDTLPAVSYDTLSCRWTSLAPFARLVEAKVIRGPAIRLSHKAGHTDMNDEKTSTLTVVGANVKDVDENGQPSYATGHGTHSADEAVWHAHGAADGDALSWPMEALRMPIVKRMESILPPDIVIADKLRALMLAAHSTRHSHGVASNAHRGVYDTDEGPHTHDESDDDSDVYDDEDDEDDYCGYDMGGGEAKLPLRTLRRLFTRAERNELLYHVLWRLVAGGGAMNQFEDDFAIYRHATRLVFRALLANGGVSARCDAAVAHSPRANSVALAESEKMQPGQEATQDSNTSVASSVAEQKQYYCYVPQVQAHVYSVTGVTGYDLFARQDELTPSNFNYCYVIVLPARQQVVLWYHSL